MLENARLDKRLHNRVIYTIRYDSCIIALIVAAKHMNQTHFDGRMQEWTKDCTTLINTIKYDVFLIAHQADLGGRMTDRTKGCTTQSYILLNIIPV